MIQRERMTLAAGVQLIVPIFAHLVDGVKSFAPNLVRTIEDQVAVRQNMLLTPYAVAANLLDHNYRGCLLPVSVRTGIFRCFWDCD